MNVVAIFCVPSFCVKCMFLAVHVAIVLAFVVVFFGDRMIHGMLVAMIIALSELFFLKSMLIFFSGRVLSVFFTVHTIFNVVVFCCYMFTVGFAMLFAMLFVMLFAMIFVMRITMIVAMLITMIVAMLFTITVTVFSIMLVTVAIAMVFTMPSMMQLGIGSAFLNPSLMCHRIIAPSFQAVVRPLHRRQHCQELCSCGLAKGRASSFKVWDGDSWPYGLVVQSKGSGGDAELSNYIKYRF